jgi:hypothetical protein
MDQHNTRSVGRVIAAMIVTLMAVVGFGSTASAGGWAVSTLDTTPDPVSGQSVEIGFTVRQHGVTPVNPDGDVGIAITSANGSIQRFPAIQVGETGHYVATVVFPAAGDYTWEVQQGWFAPQALGALTVSESATATAATGAPANTANDYRFPALARYGLPALAVVFAAAALADVIGRRRRRRTVVA